MSEVDHKRNLKPKEYHPMVHYCQEVFMAAGPDYIEYLMEYLENTIKSEETTVPPKENMNGVLLETLRRVVKGEKLDDRYLMGATLFIIHSLMPVNDVIKERVADLKAKEEANANPQA